MRNKLQGVAYISQVSQLLYNKIKHINVNLRKKITQELKGHQTF